MAYFCGMGMVALLMFAALVLLGRRASTHLVLLEIFIVGSFGVITTSSQVIGYLNKSFDYSLPVDYTVKILGKETVSGRRTTHYYVRVEDWTHEQGTRCINVTQGFWDRVAIDDKLIITQRLGYFHYRWVEEIRRKWKIE